MTRREQLDQLQSDLADRQADALRAAAEGNELTTAVAQANARVIIEHIHAVAAEAQKEEDNG